MFRNSYDNLGQRTDGKSRFFINVLFVLVIFALGYRAHEIDFFQQASELDNVGEIVGEETISTQTNLDLFWKVWARLAEAHYHGDEIDAQKMVYGAVKGMVASLDDPYTVFMEPRKAEEFTQGLDGQLVGVGIEVELVDDKLTVVTPLKGSPAEKAGLLADDYIYKVDGETTENMSIYDAVLAIRGEKGTTVTLTIVRKGLAEPFDVDIVRDTIQIDSVTVEELDGDIVYLSVNQFNEKTNEQFGAAISEMVLDEPEGLIVDLRFNGGGYLDIAVELLSYLLPSDEVAVIVKERGKEDEAMRTNGNAKLLNVPLVVLVNGASASASEIFAGAVQDHNRGVVMGTQTFGKGSVQQVDSFSDGSSLRLTIAKWYTPDDRSIDEVGITPDTIIEISEEDREAQYDRQKEEAIEYLKGL